MDSQHEDRIPPSQAEATMCFWRFSCPTLLTFDILIFSVYSVVVTMKALL